MGPLLPQHRNPWGGTACMADIASVQERPLTLSDLTDYFARGCKPKAAFRVGAEHEKFGFYLGSHAPVPYEGDKGIHALLTGLQRFGWTPVMEGPTIIGLERAGANVSLEPGGQFERSEEHTSELQSQSNLI